MFFELFKKDPFYSDLDPFKFFTCSWDTEDPLIKGIDQKNTDEGTELVLIIPGISQENTFVSISENESERKTLTIESKQKNKEFIRTFTLGTKHNPEEIEAKQKDGILTIFVPFKRETPKDVKKIEIKIN